MLAICANSLVKCVRSFVPLSAFCGDPNRAAMGMQAGEGELTEGSPAWESVPAGDRDRRKRAAADKALKLRSPNFAVSTTRLAVRNIPPSMSEKALKQLALQAVSASVKSGRIPFAIWRPLPC